jgi:ornithine carbamoyltransferase
MALGPFEIAEEWMAFNLRNRDSLKLLDFTPHEMEFLLNLSAELKKAKYTATEQPRLTGKNIALIFEKASTRTGCAFEKLRIEFTPSKPS